MAASWVEEMPTYGPIYWRVVPAFGGGGELLLGLDDRAAKPLSGAMIVAPPGVLLRTPPNHPSPLTRDGWREARWGLDANGHILVDQARPPSQMPVNLGQVVSDVARWAPQHVRWVADIV